MCLAETFRVNLRQTRISQNLSQDNLAQLSGYSESYIQRFESRTGKFNPTLSFVDAMAKSLQVSTSQLLGG